MGMSEPANNLLATPPENFKQGKKEAKEFRRKYNRMVLKNSKGEPMQKCAYCQKPLNRRELSTLSIFDFQITCKQHRYLRFVYNMNAYRIRKKFKKAMILNEIIK
jgi:hypothetical protein